MKNYFTFFFLLGIICSMTGWSKLVDLSKKHPLFLFDIRYATENNFTGKVLYDLPKCYLHEEVANALCRVQDELTHYGLRLKIFDGYRPLSVQQKMWDLVQDGRYVSNPAVNAGRHTRGTTVDLTLTDFEGQEIAMPSAFDEFSERAHCDYPGVSRSVRKNRSFLIRIMKKHGFEPLATEWWHFDYKGWKDDAKYPPMDISFTELEDKLSRQS